MGLRFYLHRGCVGAVGGVLVGGRMSFFYFLMSLVLFERDGRCDSVCWLQKTIVHVVENDPLKESPFR